MRNTKKIEATYRGHYAWGYAGSAIVELEEDGGLVEITGGRWFARLLEAGLEIGQEISLVVTDTDGEYGRPRKAQIITRPQGDA